VTLNLWTLLNKPSIQMSLLDSVIMWTELGLIGLALLAGWCLLSALKEPKK
jgi:hypothetical protein